MASRIKRKLYPRGGSFETTIPSPLLFAVDTSKKQDVIFEYDPSSQRWYIAFKERLEHKKNQASSQAVKSKASTQHRRGES